jgi:hypothetical protein
MTVPRPLMRKTSSMTNSSVGILHRNQFALPGHTVDNIRRMGASPTKGLWLLNENRRIHYVDDLDHQLRQARKRFRRPFLRAAVIVAPLVLMVAWISHVRLSHAFPRIFWLVVLLGVCSWAFPYLLFDFMFAIGSERLRRHDDSRKAGDE